MVALMVLAVVGVKAAFFEVNVVEAFCKAFSVGDMSIDSLLLFLMSSVLNVGEIDVPSVEENELRDIDLVLIGLKHYYA